MRLIAIKEPDIKHLLTKLKLTDYEMKDRYRTEHTDLANRIHRAFHYELVRFFQDQGADCTQQGY